MSRFKLKLSISWLGTDLVENTIHLNEVCDLLNLKRKLVVLTNNLDDLTEEEDWLSEHIEED